LIMAKIAAEKKANGCDCKNKNPKGKWCLPDVSQVVDGLKSKSPFWFFMNFRIYVLWKNWFQLVFMVRYLYFLWFRLQTFTFRKLKVQALSLYRKTE
jgi:hypothetical protein